MDKFVLTMVVGYEEGQELVRLLEEMRAELYRTSYTMTAIDSKNVLRYIEQLVKEEKERD